MKKERAIIIKSQRLRKVRSELRTLLKLWKEDIRSSLREEWSKNSNNRAIKIQKEISSLDLMLELSICSCSLCGSSDKDMIYIPKFKQWDCVECNSERVYYRKLRIKLQMSIEEIKEFLNRLAGEEGINLSRSGSRCNGYMASKRILDKMGINKETQDKLFHLCSYYGGHCDCEILLNASSNLLSI